MKEAADVIRWAARDLIFNLEALPEKKRDWAPSPEAKTALQIAGEVAAVFKATLPVLDGGEWQAPWTHGLPRPQTLEEARRMVLDGAERYAAALEQADPASLEKPLELPFGTFWPARFVLVPMVEVIHHRGQICYLQSLVGDSEVRFDPEATAVALGRPAGS